MASGQDDRIPSPPEGYQAAIPFHYPKAGLQIAALLVMLAAVPVLLFLTWLLQGRPPELAVGMALSDVVLLMLVSVGIILVHELVHGLAYQRFGYRVTYGFSARLLAAYAAAFGQWQKRDHNILVGLAPLVTLSLILAPLLAAPQPTVVLLAFTALLLNTAGAVGDMYLVWRLLGMPASTLLYDVDAQTMLIFLPAQSPTPAASE